jgi:cytochrome c peroxidase
MSLLIFRLSVLLLGAVTALVGCGGGNSDGSGSAPPVNQGPRLIGHNSNQLWYRGYTFSHDANANGAVFRDPEGDPLTYEFLFNSATQYPGFSVSGSKVSGIIDYNVTDMTITVIAKDSEGRSVQDTFRLDVKENSPPEALRPNTNRTVSVGTTDYDAIQGGATFRDADGHALTYSLDVLAANVPVSITGTRIRAVFDGPGFIKVKLTAIDELGAATDDIFALVVPTDISSHPALPPASYVYDDALLNLPNIHRQSRESTIPLWDTTPTGNPTTNAGATLGRVLFYDKRLSVTNTVSCGSCHEQSRGFTVGARFGVGAFGDETPRNPMALTNSRYNLLDRYFLDVRVSTLESLALMPIQDQRELGNTLALLEEKLAATDFYPPLFQAAFGTSDVTSDRIARALAQFLRSLISYRAKFDVAYHAVGDEIPDEDLILTAQERRGKDVFFESRCAFCHRVDSGAMNDTANNGLDVLSADPGRAPRSEFRAASLRNIAVSAPYMHDGRFATLREVIDFYDSGVQRSQWLNILLLDANTGTPQRLNLSEEDKQALEAFLSTFTDVAFLADPKFSDPFQ